MTPLRHSQNQPQSESPHVTMKGENPGMETNITNSKPDQVDPTLDSCVKAYRAIKLSETRNKKKPLHCVRIDAE